MGLDAEHALRRWRGTAREASDAMTSSKDAKFSVRAQEISWLVKHRADDVKALVRNFKKLTRGRRSEFGEPAAYFMSLLELEMRAQRKAARASSWKKSLRLLGALQDPIHKEIGRTRKAKVVRRVKK